MAVPALSVTIDDCEVQTFRAGGKGGQHQNKTSSGVRIIHHPSGARGESREDRSQLENKRKAFRRMAESLLFQSWLTGRLASGPSAEEWAADQVRPELLKVEHRRSGKWVPEGAAEVTG